MIDLLPPDKAQSVVWLQQDISRAEIIDLPEILPVVMRGARKIFAQQYEEQIQNFMDTLIMVFGPEIFDRITFEEGNINTYLDYDIDRDVERVLIEQRYGFKLKPIVI